MPRRTIENESFADRLWIALEAAKARGAIRSQNHLEERANIGKGYASKLLDGSRGKMMSAHIISGLADALEVNTEWLHHGTGPRNAPHRRTPDDIYPEREVAIKRARDIGLGDDAIAWVRTVRLADGETRTWRGWLAAIATHADDARYDDANAISDIGGEIRDVGDNVRPIRKTSQTRGPRGHQER